MNVCKKNIIYLKSLPRQGQSINWTNIAAQAQAGLSGLASSFSTMADSVTQRAANFEFQLTKILGNSIINLTKQFTALEERNRELNESLGTTSTQSAYIGQRLDKLSKNLTVGGDSARKLATSLNSLTTGFINTLVASADLSNGLKQNFGRAALSAQSYMRNQLKVTEEAALGYELYASTVQNAAATGENTGQKQLALQSNIATEIEKATGLQGVQRDLTEAIGGMASDLQLQYSRIPGSLELAVLKSRALGMSMETLNKTGTQLLNMESSIGDELEYQLLTGRRLLDDQGNSITNAYREATIRGDANKQAELMNEIISKEGDTLQNNLYARQQMSKLLGTDEATLAKAIQKQQVLSQLGEKAQSLMNLSGEEFETEAMKVRKNLDEKSQQALDELLASDAHDTRTTAERTADAVEKIATAVIENKMAASGTSQVDVITGSITEFNEGLLKNNAAELSTAITNVLSNPVVSTATNLISSYSVLLTAMTSLIPDLKNLMTQGDVDVQDTDLGGVKGGNAKGATDAIILDPEDELAKTNFESGGGVLFASTNRGGIRDASNNLVDSLTNGMPTSPTTSTPLTTEVILEMSRIIASAMQDGVKHGMKNVKLEAKIEKQLGGDGEFNSNPWST